MDEHERTTLTVDGEPFTAPDDRGNYNDTPKGIAALYDEDEGLYKMWVAWYWGHGSGEGARVWHYESEDGVDWTNERKTNLEHSGWYKNLRVWSAMKDEGTYKLWFGRYYHWTNCSGWGSATHYATSTDGVEWTDHGEVFRERQNAEALRLPDSGYRLYAETSGDGHCDQRAWGYESADGESWSNERGLTLDGGRMWARDGYPYVGINHVQTSADGERIVAYGWESGSIVKIETPVDDAVAFTTVETVVEDVDGRWEGSMLLADEPGGVCHVLFDRDGGGAARLCPDAGNTAPAVMADVDSVTVDEGTTATATGTVSDPDGDPVELTASVGTVSAAGDGTWRWSFETTDGPAQSQAVTVTGTDEAGAKSDTTFDLSVENVPPSLTVDLDDAGVEGEAVSLSATVEDPGTEDAHTATVDWGDGTVEDVAVDGDSLSTTHTYGSGGVYDVEVTATDDDGGSATVADSVTVTEVVAVEVKPDDDGPAPVNPASEGVVPVAIYTTGGFDATTVDVSSLRFGAPAAVEAGDGATPAHDGHVEDVDGDGEADLVVHFEGETGLESGDEVATVAGATADGVPVVGTDGIRVVGGGGGPPEEPGGGEKGGGGGPGDDGGRPDRGGGPGGRGR